MCSLPVAQQSPAVPQGPGVGRSLPCTLGSADQAPVLAQERQRMGSVWCQELQQQLQPCEQGPAQPQQLLRPTQAEPRAAGAGAAPAHTGMWWEAKDLSGSLPPQVCQELHKNVIVSQLLVIISPFLGLEQGCVDMRRNIISAQGWRPPGLSQTITDSIERDRSHYLAL